jgi:DNA-directed RNA polymerase specialized sigma24 family protein
MELEVVGGGELESEEDRRRRRLADRELVELLSPTFSGDAWTRFAEELARYGLGVMRAWLNSGEIFNKCRRRGCPCGSPPADWSQRDRADLANDTVGEAIPTFRQRALVEEGWDPDGGASLTTYFIGTCVYAFPNNFRRWKSHRRRCGSEDLTEPSSVDFLDMPQPTDVESYVLNRIVVEEGLAAIADPRTRAAVFLQAQGYTLAEIAELVSVGEDVVITARAVEGLLRRHRQHLAPTGTQGRQR